MKNIIIAGNPNVGKSTFFNKLTKQKQHTGNWTGKTVLNAKGKFKYNNKEYKIIDTPGTYSLNINSLDEKEARNSICFKKSDAIIVMCDAKALERNLFLAFQISEVKDNVILCINFCKADLKKDFNINFAYLNKYFSKVCKINAKTGRGFFELLNSIENLERKKASFCYEDNIEKAINIIENALDKDFKNIKKRFIALKILLEEKDIIQKIEEYVGFKFYETDEIKNAFKNAKNILKQNNIEDLNTALTENIYNECSKIYTAKNTSKNTLDKMVTSRWIGIPFMLILLFIIFWITIVFSNYLSALLSYIFSNIEGYITNFFNFLNAPYIVKSFFIDGIYKIVSFVVSVMLPPMAIFFPLFSLFEEVGFLPRIAFNLDRVFNACGSSGKQSLCMAMGFGCNCVGVNCCRIINCKKQRLIAILTNNFIPCNGRLQAIIALITIFFISAGFESLKAAFFLTLFIIISIIITLIVSKIFSKTILKSTNEIFALELPPYKKPPFFKTIIKATKEKTFFVLTRAILISIPAGVVIWFMTNITINDESILYYLTSFLNTPAKWIGLDGVIILAFILGFPANEIIMPLTVMIYSKSNQLQEISDFNILKDILISNGFTIKTAICTIIFYIFHYPCGSALWTIKKETNSYKWTFLAFILPTIIGIGLCFFINILFELV